MKNVKLYFTLLIVCLCIFGCFEDISNPLQVTDITSPYGEPVVQTEIPPEVLAAMKLKADRKHLYIRVTLAGTHESQIEQQELILENGFDTIDFHELQKAYYKRYIDAGGIAIVGPETVADEDLIHARDIILVMTSKYPEIRERLLSKHGTFYMVLVPYWDDMLDIPELQLTYAITRFRRGKTKDERISIPASCSMNFGPESLFVFGFCFAPAFQVPSHKDAMIRPGYTFAHEFAHAIDDEMDRLKPGFVEKLTEITAKSDIHGWYEFWANYVVEIWFYNIGPDQFYETYEDFFENYPYPEAAKMADEWFPRVSFREYSLWRE